MKIFSSLMIALVFVLPSHVFAQQAADDAAAEADRIVAAVQKICPITGNALGDHGDPVKVRIGDEELFVCCSSCLEGDVQVDPAHWATIHENFSKAQGICPVMEHDIPANAKWTVVSGRIFYVCCPPCTDKIEEQPEEFVSKLMVLYRASLEDDSDR